MTKHELLTEGRRLADEGAFIRKVTSREATAIHTDRVTLECGHTQVTFRRARLRNDDAETCHDCIAAWLKEQEAQ
jgi:hypothetical protein